MKKILQKILPLVSLLTLTTGYGQDPNAKLYEPFAPKPSHPIPNGWEVQILKGSKVENKTTLKNQKEVCVTVPAYELVPTSKAGITTLKDPGFEPNLANNQTKTIGAVLTEYSEATTNLEKKLEDIIKTLEKEIGTPTPAPKNESKKPNSPSR